MHNCKANKNQLIEAAMEQKGPEQKPALPPELERCPVCREEFASLRSLLRVTDQAFESTSPSENFWPGYQARLRQALDRESSPSFRPSADKAALVRLRNLFTTSIHVPIPVAALLILCFGLSIVFAMNSRRELNHEQISGPTSVVTKTVEVPVIHERTVTRTVFRSSSQRTNREMARLERANLADSKIANGRNEPEADTPISLVGFKPTSDPKLTIMKGSYRDEK